MSLDEVFILFFFKSQLEKSWVMLSSEVQNEMPVFASAV